MLIHHSYSLQASSASAPSVLTPRQRFLAAIGLKSDPFALPVAEDELGFSALAQPDEIKLEGDASANFRPRFFDYFCHPPLNPPIDQDVLKLLRQPQTAFIYGQPGSGKTTLRLVLSAEIRNVPERTLAVSYPLADDLPRPLTPEEHWDRLAQAIAIDLFIQSIEQFSPSAPPQEAQLLALSQQLDVGGTGLKRLLQRLLEAPTPEGPLGYGHFWPAVGRPAVRYVRLPQALAGWLRQAISAEHKGAAPLTPEARLRAAIEAAHTCGYTRLLILVDGVDTRHRDVKTMLALLTPLLQALPAWAEASVYGKFFLPLELQSAIQTYWQTVPTHLRLNLFSAKIEWTEAALRAILQERFRAAGSRRVSLNDLAGPGFPEELDTLILQTANRLPRRMLRAIDLLLKAHGVRDPEAQDRLFRPTDWNKMRELWVSAKEEEPLPPSV